MIALGVSQQIEGKATDAATVTYTVGGLLMSTASPPVASGYQVLAQGQLGTTVGIVYGPGASNTALVSMMHLFNTGAGVETVTLYADGTAGSNEIATFQIPAGGWANYDDGHGWQVYTSAGAPVQAAGAVAGGDLSGSYPSPAVVKINGSPLGTTTGAATNAGLLWNGSAWVPTTITAAIAGALASTADLSAIATANATAADVAMNSHKLTGLATGVAATDAATVGQLPVVGQGTPATAAGSLTASAANVVSGTLISIPTGSLAVGDRFRFHVGLTKTAAGTATWTVAVKFGTLGTIVDAAIATWTSGTNTAAIDYATLIIEVVVASLGASATAQCLAFYTNTLTSATGLGQIQAAPGSTATFNSAATSPFLHIDVTPGLSAVMTGWGMADRVK